MPKGVRDKRLPIKGRILVRKLLDAGFVLEEHTGGKHARYKHPTHGWLITMPRDPEEELGGYMPRRALDYCDRANAARQPFVSEVVRKLVPDEVLPPPPPGQYVRPEWLKVKAVQRVLAVSPDRPIETFREYYFNFPYREIEEVFQFTSNDIKRLCALWSIPPKDPKKAAAQQRRFSASTSVTKPGPLRLSRIEPEAADAIRVAAAAGAAVEIDYAKLADAIVQRLVPHLPKPAEVDYGKVGEGLIRYLIRTQLDAVETRERRTKSGRRRN